MALYSICFDFDKAAIKPQSEPTRREIARLLRANPALGLTAAGIPVARAEERRATPPHRVVPRAEAEA